MNQKTVDVMGRLPLERCGSLCGIADIAPRLMAEGVFAKDGLPFQPYLDGGYFALVQGAGGSAEILLTPLGQVRFGRRFHTVAH